MRYLDHQGDKLIARFDGETYHILAGAMDRHDIGRGRGRVESRSASWRTRVVLTGLGVQDDILYGPRQVHLLVDAAPRPAWRRDMASCARPRGTTHSWSMAQQLTDVIREALAD